MNFRAIFHTGILALTLVGAIPAHAAPAPVLLVQDQAPCGSNSNENILSGWGLVHDVVPIAELPSLNALANVHTIIISSNQTYDFYQNLATKMPRITRWLKGGARTLEFHTDTHCAEVMSPMTLPRGVISTPVMSDRALRVTRPRSELVTGVPRDIGPYEQLTNLSPSVLSPVGRTIIATQSGVPALIDYCVGSGRVIATGIFVERIWSAGLDSAQLLPNLLTASVYAPGCQSAPQ